MHKSTKIMFSKIASIMTIFMMVFSLIAPIVTRAEDGNEGDVSKKQESNINHDNHEDNDDQDGEDGDHYNNDNGGDEDEDEGDDENNENGDNDDDEGDDENNEGDENNNDSNDNENQPVAIVITEDVPQTATISATKILCPSEDLLPNLGNYGPDMTSTTASEFLDENPSCEQVDWNFEWSIGASYVDDNTLTGGEGWTTFSNGTTVVPAGQNIGLREQMLSGYTTFTGQNTDQNVSAEFYCGSDVLNYDNLEYVNTVGGQTYHCVAFNAHPDLCSNVEGIQIEVPKGMETDGDYCYTPQQPQEGICAEGDETYESVYVSDSSTLVGANPAAVLTFIHNAWTAVIPDASWIWSTDPVVLVPAVDEIETFTKTFEVTGTPTSASLEIAADNDYSVKLNGSPLCSDTTGNNFSVTDNCPINVLDLDEGENTLEFTVTNKEIADNLNPKINPAGLMYKLTINGECATCDQTNGWMVDYFNYTHTDTGMNLPQSAWFTKSTYGNPLSLDNTAVVTPDAWTGWSYGADKYKFSQVETDLMFGNQNFFPFDSGTGLSHKNESLSWTYNPGDGSYTMHDNTPGGKDYHFGLHAKGYVTAPVAGSYAFTLSADDDVWIYVNGTLVVDNSGVHGIPGTVTGGNIALNAGPNTVELYYAERHVTQAGLDFQFTDENLKITTSPDCDTPPPADMCLNLEGTQVMVPGGLVQNQAGNCLPPVEEPLVCNPEVNLVQNGGFENPVLDSGTWGLFPQGDLLGWLIDWIYDNEETPTLEIQNNVAGAPYQGNQHAELDGNHPVGMYQVIETIPGETYDFSYAYSARGGRDANDNKIWVEVQDSLGNTLYGVANHAVDATDTSGTVWTTYSGSFVADSETTIMFNDMGTDTSFGGYIDGVSLTCNPEPEVPMCEYNPEIPANSEDCVPPPPTCEWNSEISADSENCVPPVESCPDGYYGIFPSCYPPIQMDSCANIPEIQNGVPEGYVQDGENCYLEETPTPEKHSSSGSRVSRGGGSVLGASTDGVCAFDIDTYMRKGYKNDTAQVKVMQMLMNKYAGSTLSIDGMFGAMTEKAVKAFQSKYADEVLTGAWVGLKAPTGIFFRSTLAKAKNLECPEVTTPIPVGLDNTYNWSKAKNEIVPAQ